MTMYNEKIEQLIKAALADGVLTEKEKQILFKRAQEQGIDLDEFEMVLDAKLVEMQKAEKEKSAPKSTRFGDVRKCPACGALVPAMAVSCAECGFEFSGLEASSSAQLLAKKIEEIKATAADKKREIIQSGKYSNTASKWEMESPQEKALREIDKDADKQMKSFVSNFPVPNAKNDLFDLILYLKQHIKDEVYEQKLQECLDRAKYVFPSDSLFAQVVADATKAKDIKKAKDSGDDIMTIIAIIGIFGSLGVYYWWADSHDWGWAGWAFGWILFLAIGEAIGFGLGALVKRLYVKNKESK